MQSTQELILEADQKDKSGVDAEEWLFGKLGEAAIGFSVSTSPELEAGGPNPTTLSVGEQAALGRRILKRLEKELNHLMCGDGAEEVEDRGKLGLTGDALIGMLTTALTAGLSVGPQAAAIIAALLVRRLVQPTTDELCQYWNERLE